MRSIVVVGYGIAGLTAAETLREVGFDGDLTIVGEEATQPYSRPALSKTLLSARGLPGDTSALNLMEPRHGAVEILGYRAVELRRDEGVVVCSNGRALRYDGLVIATGSRARRFTESPHEMTLRTAGDALELRQRLEARPKVTIIGGGPLGMEVASSAQGLGCEVTLVHPGTPMSRQVGPYLGDLCAQEAKRHGVTHIDNTVRSVESTGGLDGASPPPALTLKLGSGSSLATELLITAVGDEPQHDWLENTDLLSGGRLVTDSNGFVADGIVAAGDVAWFLPTTPSAQLSTVQRVPLWMHAIDQAKAAAAALLQGPGAEPFHSRPYFWTEQFGLHIRMCGEAPQGHPIVVDGGVAERSALLHWPTDPWCENRGTAATINYKHPIPRLRRLASSVPQL